MICLNASCAYLYSYQNKVNIVACLTCCWWLVNLFFLFIYFLLIFKDMFYIFFFLLLLLAIAVLTGNVFINISKKTKAGRAPTGIAKNSCTSGTFEIRVKSLSPYRLFFIFFFYQFWELVFDDVPPLLRNRLFGVHRQCPRPL